MELIVVRGEDSIRGEEAGGRIRLLFLFFVILLNFFMLSHVMIDHSESSLFLIGIFFVCFCSIFFITAGLFGNSYNRFKKSRYELQYAKEKAEKIAQFPLNSPFPIVQISFNGDILFVNPAASDEFPDLVERGSEHAVMQGMEIFIKDALKTRKAKYLTTREISFLDKLYHQTITALVTGENSSLIIYFFDITATREAQEKARLLEAAIISAKDGVIITTADLENPQIVYVNEAFSRITGYDPEEVIGKTPRLLQGPDTDKKVLKQLSENLRAGKPFKGELKNYTKDRIAYWLDISIVPVKDKDGKITHYAAIERDITQRKAFEKELQINREAAEVANRAKSDFLANISHELRTPMNGIIGLSELMLEMNLTEEQLEIGTAVNASSRNLLILLNDILDLSKIEANELSLEHVAFDTRRIIRQTVDLLKPMASKKGVVLECSINPIVPERIICDPARLQQIMNNLVGNAIKFTEVGYVRLDITSARDKSGDPELHIRVEDTGIGIAEDKREVVFNKFTQADVSTARKYGGTGLGLAITRELVEMMGGIISFDSLEGKGTTFYVEIPIEISKERNIEVSPSKEIISFNTDAKLMIVDDHPVNLLFMRKVLKMLGYESVVEAHSGKEAIEKAEKNSFDLIFMDCQMPEIDGFEASAIIREREKLIGDIKIIAVTADAMKGAREKCIDAGMNDYISKPVDIEKLKDILGEWLPKDLVLNTAKMHITSENTTKPINDNQIMDWDRLRLFTDGNPDEEQELIKIFMTYAEDSLSILRNQINDGEDEEWKKAAHKLKGSAANLGAKLLSTACYEAETAFGSKKLEKEELLNKIVAQYAQVCTVLCKTSANA